ncbi:MAG TPA: hypothetical protein GXZ48_02830 [Acholeplasmataceae bacterium]|nr:hypothetical protein [Acholeplasmataceae bacterium]
MKNRKSKKRYVILMIAILIPVLAGFFIGLYSYNRYQENYFYEYMKNIEEQTDSKITGYLKYTTYSLEETPFYKEDVKRNNERVLTIEVYRAIKNYNEDKNIITYYFVVYNINYTKLIEIEDPTGEKKLLYNKLPGIYLSIEDKNNPENQKLELVGSLPTFYIDDYESTPEKDSKGNTLNSRFVKWYEYNPDTEFSNNLSFELIVSPDPENDLSPGIITNFDLTVEREERKIDTTNFTLGYDNDIHKAGYFSYVFNKRIWWQSLIAFALVGIISYSFYAVWTVEEQKEKK